MRPSALISSRQLRQLQPKIRDSSTKFYFSQLSSEGGQKQDPPNDGVASQAVESRVPVVVKEPEPTQESSLMRLFKHAQSFLEESSGLIELVHLKQEVNVASEKFDAATAQVAERRQRVQEAQKAHEQAHKKHVSLLMRRDEWSGEDAQAFVTITSEEVQTRQALMEAQEALRRAEDHSIQCQHAYMDVMRQRYHEEQMWQDKWRLVGTYGTWSLIGINTLVFLAGQYRAEQREIKRLKHTEQVLLKSQKEQLAVMAAVQAQITQEFEEGKSTAAAAAAATTSKNHIKSKTPSSEQVQTNEEVGAISDEDETGADTETSKAQILTNITKDFPDLPDIPLHLPSVAIGAAVSATCIILLSLVARR